MWLDGILTGQEESHTQTGSWPRFICDILPPSKLLNPFWTEPLVMNVQSPGQKLPSDQVSCHPLGGRMDLHLESLRRKGGLGLGLPFTLLILLPQSPAC